MFLRHLYPEKPGNVTLGKISSSRLYLVCGRAETENHIYKHAVDTNLARSTRKRLQATTRDASNNPITMHAETHHPVSAWEERHERNVHPWFRYKRRE